MSGLSTGTWTSSGNLNARLLVNCEITVHEQDSFFEIFFNCGLQSFHVFRKKDCYQFVTVFCYSSTLFNMLSCNACMVVTVSSIVVSKIRAVSPDVLFFWEFTVDLPLISRFLVYARFLTILLCCVGLKF